MALRADTESSAPLSQHHGVLTLYCYGILVHVDRGHLLIDDGIGRPRRHARLARGHGLKRLVVIGWCRWPRSDQKASIVMLDRDGKVLLTTAVPVGSISVRRKARRPRARCPGAAERDIRGASHRGSSTRAVDRRFGAGAQRHRGARRAGVLFGMADIAGAVRRIRPPTSPSSGQRMHQLGPRQPELLCCVLRMTSKQVKGECGFSTCVGRPARSDPATKWERRNLSATRGRAHAPRYARLGDSSSGLLRYRVVRRATASCSRCQDTAWVYVEHPLYPSGHAGCACHAVMPCPDCKPHLRPALPVRKKGR